MAFITLHFLKPKQKYFKLLLILFKFYSFFVLILINNKKNFSTLIIITKKNYTQNYKIPNRFKFYSKYFFNLMIGLSCPNLLLGHLVYYIRKKIIRFLKNFN